MNEFKKQKIKEINKLIKSQNIKIIGLINNDINQCIVECSIHGKSSEWATPWHPAINNLKSCSKCSKKYRKNEKEIVTELNQNKNYIFNGFINGYKSQNSLCDVTCPIHGRGSEWGNPWTPSVKSFLSNKGCPKCNNNYSPSEQEMLDEFQTLEFKSFTINGFIDNYKNKYSKLDVTCKIHGRGSEWGNPWTPTIGNIRDSKGCPKCSGVYNPSEQEVIKQIKKLNIEGVIINGFIDGYKNKYSKLDLTCQIHGRGLEWSNPWNPTVETIKNGSGCPKCSKKYKYTEEDILTELNENFINKYVIEGFLGKFNGSFSKCNITCKIHGNGSEWGTPWNPTVKSLREGGNCPKCLNCYRSTEKELLSEIREKFKDRYTINGFIGKFNGANSYCDITCSIHGRGSDWAKPWTPKVEKLKNGRNCPKCSLEGVELSKCLQNPKQFYKKRTLYYIKFRNLINNKFFYKIGLATEEGVVKRFSKGNLLKDNLEIVEYKELLICNIAALISEAWILRYFNKKRIYMMHIFKRNKGGSECFGEDITNIITLEKMVHKAIQDKENLLKSFNIDANTMKLIKQIKI